MGGIFSCLLILALVGWVGYAYFNPNTSSGRFLIKVIVELFKVETEELMS